MAVTMGGHALSQTNVDVLQGGVVAIVTTVRIILTNDHYEYCIHFNKTSMSAPTAKITVITIATTHKAPTPVHAMMVMSLVLITGHVKVRTCMHM